MRLKPFPQQAGLSLIEMMASLMVFAIVTVGVVPLLGTALRGSQLARSQTVARDAALQAMERARSLPYFVAYGAQTKKVDVLDVYFPCAQAPATNVASCGGDGTRSYAGGIFTIVCPPGTSGTTCTVPLPAGFSLRFDSRFVAPDGATLVTPPTNYKRDPNLATEGQLDSPPSQLLELSITATWNSGGRARSYLLRSVIGDRKFGEVRMAGIGRVNHALQASTSFVENTGRVSDLRAVAGSGESAIETRLVSTARQRLDAGSVTLVRRPATETGSSEVLGTLSGATASFNAPPSHSVDPPGVSGAILKHPSIDLGSTDVAEIGSTDLSGAHATVINELPSSGGAFNFLSTPSRYLFLQNQADLGNDAKLKLDNARKVFSLFDAGSGGLSGSTSASSTALGAGRKVETSASTGITLTRVLPVSFITTGPDWRRHVILIDNFTAQATCTSTASSGTARAGASWTASVSYWDDPDNNGFRTDGRFVTQAISSTDGSTDLRTLIGRNPLVYDGLLATDDVYLFKPTLGNGYLTSFTLKAPSSSIDASGSKTTASIDGAINITTVPTNPLLPESGLNISLGSLTCEALDRR